jgi:hypothetical protein
MKWRNAQENLNSTDSTEASKCRDAGQAPLPVGKQALGSR